MAISLLYRYFLLLSVTNFGVWVVRMELLLFKSASVVRPNNGERPAAAVALPLRRADSVPLPIVVARINFGNLSLLLGHASEIRR